MREAPPQLAAVAKAPPQLLIDESIAAVAAIKAEEARRAIINEHTAKVSPPTLLQPLQAKEMRAAAYPSVSH